MFKIQFEIKSKMTAYVWAISGYRLGQITKVWLQFQVQVSNAPVKLLPAFMWIDQLNSFKDSTNTKGMDSNWFAILLATSNLTPAQFAPIAQAMLCDPDDAWTTSFLPVGTYNVYTCRYTIRAFSRTPTLNTTPKI